MPPSSSTPSNTVVPAPLMSSRTEQGRRVRWLIENQSINRQKNRGRNLKHVYSIDPDKLKAYYLLLQMAHLLLLLLEHGSLLRRLLADWEATVRGWFGSLKNIPKRLLESLRGTAWPAES
jgi:hypothetical protein